CWCSGYITALGSKESKSLAFPISALRKKESRAYCFGSCGRFALDCERKWEGFQAPFNEMTFLMPPWLESGCWYSSIGYRRVISLATVPGNLARNFPDRRSHFESAWGWRLQCRK